MKVVILSSSDKGSASLHLPALINTPGIEVLGVVLGKGHFKSKRKFLWRKFKKILRIGIAGAWNGRKIRHWFDLSQNPFLEIQSLEEMCRQAGIPVLHCDSVNDTSSRNFIHDIGADLGISLGNGYIAPRIFNTPALGMINIHHELLPAFQNAQPIIWQIYHGSDTTGFTIHRIDRHIDTGDIILREELRMQFEETLKETVQKNMALLMERSADALKNLLLDFDSHSAKALPQAGGQSYTTPTYREFRRMQKAFEKLKVRK